MYPESDLNTWKGQSNRYLLKMPLEKGFSSFSVGFSVIIHGFVWEMDIVWSVIYLLKTKTKTKLLCPIFISIDAMKSLCIVYKFGYQTEKQENKQNGTDFKALMVNTRNNQKAAVCRRHYNQCWEVHVPKMKSIFGNSTEKYWAISIGNGIVLCSNRKCKHKSNLLHLIIT